MSLNKIHVYDVRETLKGLYNDVQARWDELEAQDPGYGPGSGVVRLERKEKLLELAHEQRGLVAAIAAINGMSVGLPLGTKVYDYRIDRKDIVEGVIVHPREVGEEDEDSTVEEWGFHEDFMEMIPVRWREGEPAAWVYFDDLARVPEL